MMLALALLLLVVSALAAFAMSEHRKRRELERERSIRAYVFPTAVLEQLVVAYPHLGPKDYHLAARALRQFFLVHLRAGSGLVTMPSKAADTLWHAFILDTQAYSDFCQEAFGAYFHHIPPQAMGNRDDNGQATWRTWRLACLEENINPDNATRLPLLFALDAKLGIPGAVEHDPGSFKRPESASGSCGGGGSSGRDSDGDGGGDGGGCGGD
ncbi:MAG: glycine-rich domain-containing protein [Rubrivivax sp.]|nr:hypothetical protein [Rubrivivax sp.]